MGSNSGSATYEPSFLGQKPQPLWASASSPIKWKQKQNLPHRMLRVLSEPVSLKVPRLGPGISSFSLPSLSSPSSFLFLSRALPFFPTRRPSISSSMGWGSWKPKSGSDESCRLFALCTVKPPLSQEVRACFPYGKWKEKIMNHYLQRSPSNCGGGFTTVCICQISSNGAL